MISFLLLGGAWFWFARRKVKKIKAESSMNTDESVTGLDNESKLGNAAVEPSDLPLSFRLKSKAVINVKDLIYLQSDGHYVNLYLKDRNNPEVERSSLKNWEEKLEAHGDDVGEMLKPLLFAVILAVVVPLYTFFILKKKLDVYNAGAVAATYGSVSAVTFVTAVSFLQEAGVEFGGHMIAALAIMESPAIIVGVILIGRFANKASGPNRMGGEIEVRSTVDVGTEFRVFLPMANQK